MRPRARSVVNAGRQKARRIAPRLRVAPIQRRILDRGHIGQPEARPRGLRHRVLVAVRILGGARDGANHPPIPIVEGSRELGMPPAPPGGLPSGHDTRRENAHGVLSHDRAVRMSPRRVRTVGLGGCAWGGPCGLLCTAALFGRAALRLGRATLWFRVAPLLLCTALGGTWRFTRLSAVLLLRSALWL